MNQFYFYLALKILVLIHIKYAMFLNFMHEEELKITLTLPIRFQFLKDKCEASYFDRINMTKNWLEYDRKNITPTNMNDGT